MAIEPVRQEQFSRWYIYKTQYLFKGRITPLPQKSNPRPLRWSVLTFARAKHPLHNHNDVLGMSAQRQY